jgi:hypothetical protein
VLVFADEVGKMRVKMFLHPDLKYDFHLADFHEILIAAQIFK